jgi:hypothetical protein
MELETERHRSEEDMEDQGGVHTFTMAMVLEEEGITVGAVEQLPSLEQVEEEVDTLMQPCSNPIDLPDVLHKQKFLWEVRPKSLLPEIRL